MTKTSKSAAARKNSSASRRAASAAVPCRKPATAAARRRRKAAVSLVGALPEELIVDIVAHVAASSEAPTDDLQSLRSTCKALYEASKEPFVASRVAVENETSMSWWQYERYFVMIAHCAMAGNAEACFILGSIFAFKHHMLEQGMRYLSKGANAGNMASAYVLGLLFYKGSGVCAAATQYFDQIERADEAGKQWEQCRRRAAQLVQQETWSGSELLRSWMVAGDEEPCRSRGCGVARPWDGCAQCCSIGCRMRYEYEIFFAMIRGRRWNNNPLP